MTELKINVNYAFLEEKVAFANTPMYLYQNFRRDDSIIRLASANSTYELQHLLSYLIENGTKDLNNLVLIYSIIIALTFKNPKEVDPFFEKLSDTKIKWAKEISDIYFSNVKMNSDSHFNYKINPQIIQFSNVGTSSSHKTFTVDK